MKSPIKRSLSHLLLFTALLAGFITMPLNAETLHAMLIADTHDPNIGFSAQKDLDNLTLLMKEISQHTELKLNLITISGKDVQRDTILSRIEALQLEPAIKPQDVIFFHWTGYGSNYDGSSLPVMNLPKDRGGDFAVADIMRQLEKKQPRLLIVMADACNKPNPETAQTSENVVPPSNPLIVVNPAKYRQLFKEYSGWIVASSAKKGLLSYGNELGGRFTEQFIRSFKQQVAASNLNAASWQAVFFGQDGQDDNQGGATQAIVINQQITQLPQAKLLLKEVTLLADNSANSQAINNIAKSNNATAQPAQQSIDATATSVSVDESQTPIATIINANSNPSPAIAATVCEGAECENQVSSETVIEPAQTTAETPASATVPTTTPSTTMPQSELVKADERVKNELLSAEMIEILGTPDIVESFSLNWRFIKNMDPNKTVGGYEILYPGSNLTEEQVTRLKQVFFKETSYLFDNKKRCNFMPDTGLRYHKDGQKLDVVLSFHCEMVIFYDGKRAFKEYKNKDIDPSAAQLQSILAPQLQQFQNKP